ncbi:MAG TPA: HAD family hydrolase [Micromonosporaceae bacterium]|nr:HAD family hydrolase [Micromonosporaceae bacterium]
MSASVEMSQVRAVVFDFFGTLTRAMRRGPGHDEVARRLGIDPRIFARVLDDTFMARTVGAFGGPLTTLAVVAVRAGAPAPSRSALRQAYADRTAAVRSDVHLRPDAVIVLRAVRARGLRTAVLSDCTRELAAFWGELPVAGLVDARVLSIEERRHKPDPVMYQTVAHRIGVEPRHCLYVGDGGSRELTGAGAAGMTALRLAADDLADHLVFGADDWTGPSVRSLSDVIDVLSGVQGG